MPINNMKARLGHMGGADQIDRMNKDKLHSLKKALLYSYQAATAILSDGREFRCLINPNRISVDLDNKILSIPFRDFPLNAGGGLHPNIEHETNKSQEGYWEDMEDLVAVLSYIEDSWENMVPEEEVENLPDENEEGNFISGEEQDIGVAEGDIITWKENGSHWLVYSRRLEETAYFRGEIRRCRYELTLGNGSKYWAYVRGPVEQSILWTQGSGNYINKLNYSLQMYISQTEESLKYFKRFKKIIIDGKPWEVQSVDNISTRGVLEVFLKETYRNTIEENIEEAVKKSEKKDEVNEQSGTYIHGASTVYPYDVRKYSLKNYNRTDGEWKIKNESKKGLVKGIAVGADIELQVLTGKSGSFTLYYEVEGKVIAELDITIDSL